jgi:RNA polymerase sigma-70 factor, ECF subfamily
MTPLFEPSVIEHARRGDVGAFNSMVTAYRGRVCGVITRLTGRPEDVDDVAQDVFLKLHQSLETLSAPSFFDPWLYRIIVNATRDYLQRRKKSGGQRPESVCNRVDSLLSRLPADDRLLLILKEVEGLSLNQLQQIYGSTPEALEDRLLRARQRALKLLEKMD